MRTLTLDNIPKIFTSFLWILACIYGLIQRIRERLYLRGVINSYKLPVKVVCIGNITVGGTGKTPTVIALAKLLQKNGRKVAVVSRGYKRTSKEETLIVSKGDGAQVTWEQAGDEPYLLAGVLNVPIVVGTDRYRAGLCAVENFQPDIILLDDGYQHLRLRRTINMLVINAANPFGNGRLLPAGILREPLSAMKRAHVILLSKSDQAEDLNALIATIKKYNPQAPIFKAVHKPSALVELGGVSASDGDVSACPQTETIKGNVTPSGFGLGTDRNTKSVNQKDWGINWLQGKQIATLSGIGDPASFRHLLAGLGANVVNENAYPDHYSYQPNDLKQVQQNARKVNAQAIVTTTKDALRLPKLEFENGQLPVLALKIELSFAENLKDWEYFWSGF